MCLLGLRCLPSHFAGCRWSCSEQLLIMTWCSPLLSVSFRCLPRYLGFTSGHLTLFTKTAYIDGTPASSTGQNKPAKLGGLSLRQFQELFDVSGQLVSRQEDHAQCRLLQYCMCCIPPYPQASAPAARHQQQCRPAPDCQCQQLSSY